VCPRRTCFGGCMQSGYIPGLGIRRLAGLEPDRVLFAWGGMQGGCLRLPFWPSHASRCYDLEAPCAWGLGQVAHADRAHWSCYVLQGFSSSASCLTRVAGVWHGRMARLPSGLAHALGFCDSAHAWLFFIQVRPVYWRLECASVSRWLANVGYHLISDGSARGMQALQYWCCIRFINCILCWTSIPMPLVVFASVNLSSLRSAHLWLARVVMSVCAFLRSSGLHSCIRSARAKLSRPATWSWVSQVPGGIIERKKGLQGLQEKGLQSRSATASLLIKKLIVFLAQKSRHVV